MKLSDKVYDTLKWIVTIVLPALSALYWGLSGIWGWLYAEQVVGTVACLLYTSVLHRPVRRVHAAEHPAAGAASQDHF